MILQDDGFNCPKCGAHDWGLFRAAMLGCPHCNLARIRDLEAREATWSMRHERETAVADKACARVKELESALRKFGKHTREVDCWPKCECGLEAALGSALETKVESQPPGPYAAHHPECQWRKCEGQAMCNCADLVANRSVEQGKVK